MAQPFMQQSNQRTICEQRYKSARWNLLLVVIFTVINMALLLANTDYYFLFSSFVPYYLTSLGMFLCGHYPAEYYTDDMLLYDNSLFVTLLIISVICVLLYLLAWLFSNKNRVGWLIFALVFFVVDTIGMFYISGFSVESAIDILFHAWVIYYLVLGVVSHFKLKKLPPEEVEAEAVEIQESIDDIDETEPIMQSEE